MYAHISKIHKGTARKTKKCDICSKESNSKQHLETHIAIHDESKKKITCDKCDKTFACSSFLKYHMESKHENDLYQCNQCDRTFNHLQTLRQHVKRAHDGVTLD